MESKDEREYLVTVEPIEPEAILTEGQAPQILVTFFIRGESRELRTRRYGSIDELASDMSAFLPKESAEEILGRFNPGHSDTLHPITENKPQWFEYMHGPGSSSSIEAS